MEAGLEVGVHWGDNKGRLGKLVSPFLVTRGETSTAPFHSLFSGPRYYYLYYNTEGSSPALDWAPMLKPMLSQVASWYEVTSDHRQGRPFSDHVQRCNSETQPMAKRH